MYRYRVKGRSLSIPGRVIRLTVTAKNADDARRVAQIRNPDIGSTVETPRRAGLVVDTENAGSRAGHNHRATGLMPDRDASDGLELRDAPAASTSTADGTTQHGHAYFHPGPQDCRDYSQCHARAYGVEEPEGADPMTQAKAREFARWRDTDVEVV